MRILILYELKGLTSLESNLLPDQIKNNAKWWSDGIITENDFLNGIQFLVNSGIIKVN